MGNQLNRGEDYQLGIPHSGMPSTDSCITPPQPKQYDRCCDDTLIAYSTIPGKSWLKINPRDKYANTSWCCRQVFASWSRRYTIHQSSLWDIYERGVPIPREKTSRTGNIFLHYVIVCNMLSVLFVYLTFFRQMNAWKCAREKTYFNKQWTFLLGVSTRNFSFSAFSAP